MYSARVYVLRMKPTQQRTWTRSFGSILVAVPAGVLAMACAVETEPTPSVEVPEQVAPRKSAMNETCSISCTVFGQTPANYAVCWCAGGEANCACNWGQPSASSSCSADCRAPNPGTY